MMPMSECMIVQGGPERGYNVRKFHDSDVSSYCRMSQLCEVNQACIECCMCVCEAWNKAAKRSRVAVDSDEVCSMLDAGYGSLLIEFNSAIRHNNCVV